MRTAFKFLLLVIVLNLIRHLFGWHLEGRYVLPGMFGVMEKLPGCFNADFSSNDFAVSLFYNFMLWLSATWIFHVAHSNLSGSWVAKSLKIYGLCCLFFLSLTAVYMNHFADPARPFYLYSMLDAIILFPIIAVANGPIYPKLFKSV